MPEPVRLLHVDDEPDFPETTATFLEREIDGLSVRTAPNAEVGLSLLDAESFDCVVSDYDMPGRSGVEFLETVRDRYGDLPFLLFTGKGSEEVASAAISAGVTDYLQKGSETEQYAVLANRIENAVGHYRTQRSLEENRRRLSLFLEQSPLGVIGYDESFSVNENVRKDGERIVCEWHNRVVTDEDGEVVSVFSLFQDVTEEQEARDRLRQSERRYRTLVENFPGGGVFLFDEECRCVLAGGAELERVGIDPQDRVGKHPHAHYPEEIADELVAYYRKALAGEEHVFEQSYEGERYRIHTVPIRGEDGSITEGMAVSQNVTERRSRELRLERLHEATRELIHAETAEAVAAAVVEAASDILGFSILLVRLYDPDAGGLVPVAGTDPVDELFEDRPVFGPESGSLNWRAYEAGEPRVYDDILEADAAVDSDTGLRSLMIHPIGEFGTLSVGETAVDAFDETDVSLARILATAAEAALGATERETALREQRNELERQNDRLDEFASVVSHDLRNPLNVAQGRVDLARDGRDDEHLEAIDRALDRMETLIDNVLLLAREGEEALEWGPVSLSAVLESCRDVVAADEATLVAGGDRVVLADGGRLRQLFENLVRNSVEHGNPTATRDGHPDVVDHGPTGSAGAPPHTGEDDERGTGAVTVTVGETDTGFYVEDDGDGIPEEARGSVFDPGFSTSAEGTGFGLSIVRSIAEEHGWTVRETGSAGGGARFEFDGVEFADEPP